MERRQETEGAFTRRRQHDADHAGVVRLRSTCHQILLLGVVDELNDGVVLELQPVGQLLDRRPFSAGEAASASMSW